VPALFVPWLSRSGAAHAAAAAAFLAAAIAAAGTEVGRPATAAARASRERGRWYGECGERKKS
jgi:hypothetical protein